MVHMADAPKFFDPHLDLFRFTYPLPHLTESINRGRRTKIVAIGSSSTAGEPTAPDWQVRIVPYPARLELALRREHFGCMIDVLNRGLGGQEAPDELARFECDVIAEAPAMVIWQVGGNAVFHQLNLDEVKAAIISGLRWLSYLPMDVVLMDLPYTTALTIKERIGLSIEVQKIILDAAAQAKVNVFRRWDLMKKWVDDRVTTIEDLTDPLDKSDHLHMNEWGTACVSNALFRTIVAAPPATATAS
jgi:hypothetical protein